jgi:hypothetical protein
MFIVDTLLGWLNTILGTIFFFLPNDPFTPYINSMAGAEWLGNLNWFIPFGTLVGIGGSWLVAVAVFYVYQVILRWVKAIGS